MEKKVLKYKGYEIYYNTYIEKINGNDFRKHFVIDFNKLNENQINYILNNFDNFQMQLLGFDYFYYKSEKYNCSLFLHLLNLPKNKNYESILNNYNYCLKEINDNIKLKDKDIIINNQKSEYSWNNQKFTISNFNLIYGNNATGKTRLIRSYGEYKNIPVFQLVRNFESGNFLVTSTERLSNFKKILKYCKENRIPILLDDMFWGSFDSKNTIKIIDELYDSSINNQVVFTSEQELPKTLVLKRTHDYNIIDLNISK